MGKLDEGTIKTPMLHASVKVEIVKPLDCSWEDAGNRLHALRSVMHRILNNAVTAQACASFQGAKTKETMASARKAVKDTLGEIRTYHQGRLASGKSQRPDRDERMGTIALPSAIEDYAALRATQAFAVYRKTSMLGEKSLPSFRNGAPIALRDGDNAWRVERDGTGYILSAKLHPLRGPMTRFMIGVDGPSAHAHMRRMTDREALSDGTVKRGDLKILWDERRRKWFAFLVYAWPKPAPKDFDPEKAMAVHLGIRNFLSAATSDGWATTIDEGGQILAFKAQMDRRRSSLRAHKRNLGHGARGHGEARRYEVYRALGDKEERFMKTKNQQTAAAVVKLAKAKGIGTLLLEDYSPRDLADNVTEIRGERLIRRWGFAELRAAITWAANREGLATVVVPSFYESVTCPQCKHIDAANDGGRGLFTCTKCGLKRPTDQIAARNMLAAYGAPTGLKESEERTATLVAGLRKKRKTKGSP